MTIFPEKLHSEHIGACIYIYWIFLCSFSLPRSVPSSMLIGCQVCAWLTEVIYIMTWKCETRVAPYISANIFAPCAPTDFSTALALRNFFIFDITRSNTKRNNYYLRHNICTCRRIKINRTETDLKMSAHQGQLFSSFLAWFQRCCWHRIILWPARCRQIDVDTCSALDIEKKSRHERTLVFPCGNRWVLFSR